MVSSLETPMSGQKAYTKRHNRHASRVERSVKGYLLRLLSPLDWEADGERRKALAFARLISLFVFGFGLCRNQLRLARSLFSRLVTHRLVLD
jgi:hypothetical protein